MDAVTRCLGALDTDDEAASVLARLRDAGIRAERVRDIGEVFADPLLARRGMVRALTASDGSRGALLGAPFGLTDTPPRESVLIGAPNADRAAVISDWLRTTAPSALASVPA